MQKKGFTLIEMLIVIAIIGILASIVLVGLGPVQRNARDARRASDLRQIQTLLELCYARAGSYPADIAVGTIQGCSGAANTQVPVDPTTNVAYVYATDGATYVIMATLEATGNPLLNNDVQGTVQGVDCDGQNYCVGI